MFVGVKSINPLNNKHRNHDNKYAAKPAWSGEGVLIQQKWQLHTVWWNTGLDLSQADIDWFEFLHSTV